MPTISCFLNFVCADHVGRPYGSAPNLGSDVVVYGVDHIVQQVDVQLLREVQQLSGCMIRQHGHFCWHGAAEGTAEGERGHNTFKPTPCNLASLKPWIHILNIVFFTLFWPSIYTKTVFLSPETDTFEIAGLARLVAW